MNTPMMRGAGINMRAVLSGNPEAIAQIQRVLSVFMAVVTFASATVSTLQSGAGVSSSPLAQAEQPGLDSLVQPLDTYRVWEDATIRNDIVYILNRSRTDTARPIVHSDFGLSMQAQKWAERNATTDSYAETPAQVVMVQAVLPSKGASAAKFLEVWFNDPASQKALARKDVNSIGVGVASAGDKTYAVIQLS
ncbi:hypothetical protein GCM10009621_22650 [Corynebacterium felinum]|nr:CAP domain-containing protein [Corynebacterium felinum]